MALALMSIGEKRTVQTLRGKDETLRHLQDLGFAPGKHTGSTESMQEKFPEKSQRR